MLAAFVPHLARFERERGGIGCVRVVGMFGDQRIDLGVADVEAAELVERELIGRTKPQDLTVNQQVQHPQQRLEMFVRRAEHGVTPPDRAGTAPRPATGTDTCRGRSP